MTPDRTTFKKLAQTHNTVPVYVELVADTETPVSVLMRIADKPDAFLFESAESVDNWGRYSFLGFSPKAVFTLNDGVGVLEFADGRKITGNSDTRLGALAPLREYVNSRKVASLAGLPPFVGGAVGFFGYETVNLFERLPAPKGGKIWDDARLGVYDDIVIFDNLRHTAKIVSCAHVDEFDSPDAAYDAACARIADLRAVFKGPMPEKYFGKIRLSRGANAGAGEFAGGAADRLFKSNMSEDDFCAMVEKCKQYIYDGEIIQVVPSQRFSAEGDFDPVEVYRALRLINPSPYMFFEKIGDKFLVGSSPETLLRFASGEARVRPIAGTRRRGANAEEDAKLANELLSNEKECAEHLMLVDLGRNDLSRFCVAGSVQVSDFMKVERYSHVMHMVSDVSGQPRDGVDAFEALSSAFPAGTLSGAPKIRAMQIINELEPVRRGPYGGAVGYVGYGGSMDMAITIRTIQFADGAVHVQAGAGIVADSDPEAEFNETKIKARALENAVKASRALDGMDIDVENVER